MRGQVLKPLVVAYICAKKASLSNFDIDGSIRRMFGLENKPNIAVKSSIMNGLFFFRRRLSDWFVLVDYFFFVEIDSTIFIQVHLRMFQIKLTVVRDTKNKKSL